MRKLFFVTLLSSSLILSCTSTETIVDQEVIQEIDLVDSVDTSLNEEVVLIDTTSAIDVNGYVDEEKEMMQAANAAVPQWDFCTCILAADSINKAMETADDATFDLLIERDAIVSQKCKIILAHKTDTPDARKKHDRKVKKCLKNAQ
jgi:hypothetical protein